MAARISIRHNSIYRVPAPASTSVTAPGVGIKSSTMTSSIRRWKRRDHGAFNSWGRDRYWDPDRAEMNRRVVSDPALIGLDAVEPTTLRHNRLRCDHGWDIDLDDGSATM